MSTMTLRYNLGQASYVLIGDSESKNEFLSKFIKEENIKNFNLFDYQEKLKIPQVREIKKQLWHKALSGKKRLFIIRDATVEAQNALLKTLEELSDDTIFIFLEYSVLIPTILSRVRSINLRRQNFSPDANLLNLFREFLVSKKDISSALLFSEKLFSQYPDPSLDDLIISLREILLEELNKNRIRESITALKLLKSLYEYIPLQNNNLNKRVLIEKILIRQTH
jgi:hypothetical protein